MVNIIDVAYTYMCLGDHHLHKCIKCSLKTIEDYYFKISLTPKRQMCYYHTDQTYKKLVFIDKCPDIIWASNL